MSCRNCPKGRYAPTGKEESCLLCDSEQGLVAPKARSSSCLKCGAGTFASEQSHLCEKCQPPTYSQTATNECTQCPPNQYSKDIGATICQTCDAGKVVQQGQIQCVECPSGKVANSGDLLCTTCASGKFSTVTTCSECDSGTYSSEGQGECTNCEAGKYSTADKTICQSCPAGRFSKEKAPLCTICDSGTFCPVGASAWTICPQGTYSGPESSRCQSCNAELGLIGPSEGRSECSMCGVGKFASADTHSCEACPPSFYSLGGSGECLKCPQNEYSNAKEGARSCNLCAQGKVVNKDQTGCDDCPLGYRSSSGDLECSACSAGKYIAGGGNTCSLCSAGKYSSEASTKCGQCPAGTRSVGDRSHCEACPPGSYAEHESSSSCSICDGGTSCPGGSVFGEPCPPGRFAKSGSSSCEICNDFSFTRLSGQSSCLQCPLDQKASADRTSCVCKDGFVTVQESNNFMCLCEPGKMLEKGICKTCPKGMFKETLGNSQCESCDKRAVRGSFSTWSSIIQQQIQEQLLNGTIIPLPVSPYNCTCEKGDYFMAGVPEGEDQELFGDRHGHCIPCPEGAECIEPGVTVETMKLQKGWWRSDDQSVKLEKCRVEGACVQTIELKTFSSSDAKHVVASTKGFETNMQCEEGHGGPLCNVCLEDYSKNTTGLCQSCEERFKLPTETIGLVVGGTLLALVLIWAIKKRKSKRFSSVHRHMNYKTLRMSLRTKFKILVCYYQIVTQYERILGIHFPPVFEQFLRWVSSLVNFDAIKLGSVDCFVPTNFYTGLVLFTITPIVLSVIVMGIAFSVSRFLSYRRKQETAKTLWDSAMEFFLGLAFFTFSSVSTRIFDTFNCDTFGDDPTSYLVVDESVSCDLPIYGSYKWYATTMILFYPVGIPIVFAYLLVKYKSILNPPDEKDAVKRERNPEVQKLSFLWAMYEPRLWWWEIFECVRRISMTGMLIFVRPGSASQLVLAMILAVASVVAFVKWRPYVFEEDDNLAIACQLSIFFTIFGALLIRVEVDETDEYNQQLFGQLLIGVNLLSILVIAFNFFQRPISWVLRLLNNDSRHTGSIKDLGHELEDKDAISDDHLVKYFQNLALCDAKQAGYSKVRLTNIMWVAWAKDCGALLEWRNDKGNGPINEGRVKFKVKLGVEEVRKWIENPDCNPRDNSIQHYEINKGKDDGKRILYTAKKLPFPFGNRDYLTEQISTQSDHEDAPGSHLIVARSILDEEAFALKESSSLSFVRAKINLKGYFLQPGKGYTDVTYVVNLDLGGWFSHSKQLVGLKWGLKHVVDSIQGLEKHETLTIQPSKKAILGEEVPMNVLGFRFTKVKSEINKAEDRSNQAENPMARNLNIAGRTESTEPDDDEEDKVFERKMPAKLESTKSVYF